MKYTITALAVRDFKTVHEVVITPPADSSWILLGGDNANGKTSVLEAIEALLRGAGAVIEEPVRDGAAHADLRATLTPDDDSAPLKVWRRIGADGETEAFEVRDDMGTISSPQTLLNSLFGKQKYHDPLEFIRLKGPEQRQRLLQIIDADGKIADLDLRRSRLFAKRTEVGRELDKAKITVAAMPDLQVGDPVNIGAISAELDKLGNEIAARQVLINRHESAARQLTKQADRVIQAQAAVERAQAALLEEQRTLAAMSAEAEEARCKLPSADEVAAMTARQAHLREQQREASEHNQNVAMRRAEQAKRSHQIVERDRYQYEHDQLSQQIDGIDAEKKARLLAAKLPIPGLSFTDNGVTYNGKPLSSASGAQRLCVAIAMAAASQPKLRDVWIRDAAILDDKTMAAVHAFAVEHGIQLWLERVGTRDPGVIEIREGRIASQPQTEMFR